MLCHLPGPSGDVGATATTGHLCGWSTLPGGPSPWIWDVGGTGGGVPVGWTSSLPGRGHREQVAKDRGVRLQVRVLLRGRGGGAFMEYSSSVLSPPVSSDKNRRPDLADFLVQQVRKQMPWPPSRATRPWGGREGQVHLCPRHVRVGQIRGSFPLPSALRYALRSGLRRPLHANLPECWLT